MITLPELDCRLARLEGSADVIGGVEFINADLLADSDTVVTARTSNAFVFAALNPWQDDGATGDCSLTIVEPPAGKRGRITVLFHRDSSTDNGDANFSIYTKDAAGALTYIANFGAFDASNGRRLFTIEWNGFTWVHTATQELEQIPPHLINTSLDLGPGASLALTFAAAVTVTHIPRVLIRTASGFVPPTAVSGTGTTLVTLSYAGHTAVPDAGAVYATVQYDPTHPKAITGGSGLWDYMTQFRVLVA